MSPSVECLRTFVLERLTVAAEEILRVVHQKIEGYEDEVNYQRRLVESVWRPEIKLHRTGFSQRPPCQEEEVPTHQHQDESCSLDQENSEPPAVKEVQEESWCHWGGEQMTVKQESNASLVTPIQKDGQSGDPVETSVSPEPDCDLQLPSNSPIVAESKDHNNAESGSTPGEELKPTEKRNNSPVAGTGSQKYRKRKRPVPPPLSRFCPASPSVTSTQSSHTVATPFPSPHPQPSFPSTQATPYNNPAVFVLQRQCIFSQTEGAGLSFPIVISKLKRSQIPQHDWGLSPARSTIYKRKRAQRKEHSGQHSGARPGASFKAYSCGLCGQPTQGHKKYKKKTYCQNKKSSTSRGLAGQPFETYADFQRAVDILLGTPGPSVCVGKKQDTTEM
ncbi:unnamed protein product [Tetraodon nigroviridis]|uniref:(spotted green pufferfish) hypothetical protein n=1 Tax=Tetraodon nigroviridis TaxID=99883 RepID=Q4STH1_TETNG|nr:unnamed protein product [Tetraodon nigroviridis]